MHLPLKSLFLGWCFFLCSGGLFQTSQRVLMYVKKTLKVQEVQKYFFFKPVNHYKV
jgi:hypothetical protein